MMKILLVLASFLGGTSVALGAFLAHSLKNSLSEHMLTVFETGVRYQMYHSLALFVALFAYKETGAPLFLYSGVSFILGTLLFSGSLYILATTGIKSFGMITPIGGVLFLVGWGLLLVGFVRS